MFAWIASLMILLVLLWTTTELSLRQEEERVRSYTMHQVTSLAISYGTQLKFLTEQMNQILLGITAKWEDAPDLLDLEHDRQRGLFPNRDEFFVYILDKQGRLIKASGEFNRQQSFPLNGFFEKHKKDCCKSLLITVENQDPNINDQLVFFSRRLNLPDGTFGGVAVISVRAHFLVTFQGEALQGNHDFVSVRLLSGELLATLLGAGAQNPHRLYLQRPDFPLTQGTRRETSEKFQDAKVRYVAWRQLTDYPLVTLAGLTEEDAFAGYQILARDYRLTATMVSIFFLIFAGVGMRFSEKLAARRRAEENVRSTYRVATDAANEGFYMLRPVAAGRGKIVDFHIEDCNDRAAVLLGSTCARLTGQLASQVMSNKLREDFLDLCHRALEYGIYEDELRVPSQGGLNAQWLYRRAVHSGAGVALTLRDISELKAHEQMLADLANKDALTLLPNRRWLGNFLPEAMQRTERAGSRLALFFIDLDNFKLINDTLGHQAGDELLIQAAHRICHAVRASDHVVRLGGDEFTVVLEHIDSDRDIARVAESILGILAKPFTLNAGAGNRVSASIGISIYPNDGEDADSLIKHADVAMYAAKAEGKARYHFYHSRLSDAILLRLSKERALRQAIENDEFVIHYQPRAATQSGRLCSLEALLRWQHPEQGLVLPMDFIDVAEDAGLIVPIGEIVIEKVAAQLNAWRHCGLRVVPVSVNISPYQLQSGTTAAFFDKMVKRYRLPSHWLEVEVTESAVVDRSEVVSSELDALRRQGVRLMIDDFGAGYSSLAQLHRLDVDVLKVDQAFTRELFEGSEGEMVYRAVVSMAVALNMQVVAEGVETLAQLSLLQKIGCDEIQGYIVSPALPPGDIEVFLKKTIMPPFDEMKQLAVV